MKRILISGSSGLVGKKLTAVLKQGNYAVFFLTRDAKKADGKTIFFWNPDDGFIADNCPNFFDAIINLNGAGIADKRWTAERKNELLQSRIKPTRTIVKNLLQGKLKTDVLINASAIGYYGMVTSDKIYTETDSCGNDFLSDCCKQWENETVPLYEINLRLCLLRIGIVLAKNEGALKKLAAPVKTGFASALGKGKQYMPWIHLEDLCSMMVYIIGNNKINGAVNAVSSEAITNTDFTKKVARHFKKPFFLPNVPALFLKLLLGEMSAMVLTGSRISNEKIKNAGFNFKYETLSGALKNLYH
jgi:uncharacterized protein (TIGR01777 family)